MSGLNTICAEDFEKDLDEIDIKILQCLKDHLKEYLPDDTDYFINRIRDKLVLEEIEKVFIVNNW